MNWKYISRDGKPRIEGRYIIAQVNGKDRWMTTNWWRNGGWSNVVQDSVYAYLREPPPIEPPEVK